MDSKPSIIINTNPFPSDDMNKASKEFGLLTGKAIEGEWFRRSGISCRFYDKYGYFNNLRLYARGEQSIAKYKAALAHEGDLSYLNINWDNVPIAAKFVDIVVNGMQDRMYEIKAQAQDIMSADEKNIFQEMVQADMVAKDVLLATKNELGIDMFNVQPDDLPDNNEELSLYMQLKYKPSIEIAEEVAINTIFENNDYVNVKRQIDYDQTVLGLAVAKHSFYPNAGLKIEYVDPANFIFSYTEMPDFSDCYYFGEIKQVHYSELIKIKPDLTDEEITEIKDSGSAWYNYYPITRTYYDNAFTKDLVTLLYFNYKATKKYKYKKKYLNNGGERIIKKDESFNVEANDMFEVVDMPKTVWYEGVLVAGTNIMLKWELAENMVRPKSAAQDAFPMYVCYAPRMYNGRFDSIVKRMIPFIDNIQLVHLKLQQIQARVVPDGVFIDADGINEVDLGTGQAYNPEDALKLYFQTGSVIGRSYTGDGEFNNARVPIQELTKSSGQDKISSLVYSYNHYLNMIRDVTGLNEARDGSTPSPDALVGVQKLAALNSNTATRHILDAGLSMTKKLAECVSIRISDILEFSPYREQFAMQIGKYNLAILDDIKELYLRDFGIFIDLMPDEEEKQMLENNIAIALQTQQIYLDDAIDIRNVKNIKLANELLKVKRKKREVLVQEQKQQEMQMQAQMNQQSAMAASQGRLQEAEMGAQYKAQLKEIETAMEIKKMQFEVNAKKELMEIEFNYNMQLKGIEVDGMKKVNDEKEQAKDKRVDLQASRQSELIEQRQKELPAKNFESTNDSLGDFDLESFAPR
jgi:hypothetical protein